MKSQAIYHPGTWICPSYLSVRITRKSTRARSDWQIFTNSKHSCIFRSSSIPRDTNTDMIDKATAGQSVFTAREHY